MLLGEFNLKSIINTIKLPFVSLRSLASGIRESYMFYERVLQRKKRTQIHTEALFTYFLINSHIINYIGIFIENDMGDCAVYGVGLKQTVC